MGRVIGGSVNENDKYGLLDRPDIEKLDRLPEGWKVAKGTFTQPNGWVWAVNGKTMKSGEYRKALVKEEGL